MGSLEEGFNSVSTWLDVNTSNGPLVMGDSITYGDTVVAAPKISTGVGISSGTRTFVVPQIYLDDYASVRKAEQLVIAYVHVGSSANCLAAICKLFVLIYQGPRSYCLL